MRERFEAIYATNEWQHGSGEGSLPVHTRQYCAILEKFMREHRISSVLDLGCGDWQFSQFIDWEGINYVGYDIVRPVVEANQKKYARKGVDFRHFSGDFEELPSADLLIVKDVLQHWSRQTVERFLPTLERYRFSILTNCINPRGRTENKDICDGEFRYLDLRLPPFNLKAKELLTFSNHRPFPLRFLLRPRWTKTVLQFQSQSASH